MKLLNKDITYNCHAGLVLLFKITNSFTSKKDVSACVRVNCYCLNCNYY